jgi:hypothetical protein
MRLIPATATTRSYAALCGAAVLAIVLTACDQGDPSSNSSDPSSKDDELSPLQQYIGDALGFSGNGMSIQMVAGQSAPTEEERQKEREVQDKVKECMTAEGFEYYSDGSDAEGSSNPWEEAYSLPKDEFVEKYGYGVSTLAFADDDDSSDGPNEQYVDSLSDEAAEEYWQALHGEDGGARAVIVDGEDADESATAGPSDDADFGCYGEASEEVYGKFDERNDPFSENESLMEDLFQLAQRIDDDPQVAEAAAAWSDCMADAGYSDFDGDDIGEPEATVFQRMEEIGGFGNTAPGDNPGDDPGAEPDPDDLKELQEYELDIAQADYTCKEEHYNDAADKVRWKLEEEFVEQHKDELEQLRDQLADSGMLDSAAS